MVLTKEHFADVAARVARDELAPGEAYKLLGRLQRDRENDVRVTAEHRLEMMRLYTESCLSMATIGKVLGYTEFTVKRHLESVGVKIRSLSEAARPRVKLTDEQVREIRVSKEPQSVLARRYGVTKSRISMIKHLKSRANVPDVEIPEGLEGKRQALNMLPTLNQAVGEHIRKAERAVEQTGHILKTVANTTQGS